MKFGIISDIHLGPEGYYQGTIRKINKNAKSLLKDFVEAMNQEKELEFVVVLGDLIEDDNKLKDRRNIQHIVDLFDDLNCPVHYVAGNHDLVNLTERELVELFKQESLYYSFDSASFHFIVLYPKIWISDNIHIWLPQDQKMWLQNELSRTSKQSIIFTHYSFADQDLTGNPWFEGFPDSCLVSNRKQVRDIIADSDNVAAVFNGHLHWNKKNVHDGVPYFTIQSLVENENDNGIPSKAYAVANIGSDEVRVDIRGNYPKKFSHSI